MRGKYQEWALRLAIHRDLVFFWVAAALVLIAAFCAGYLIGRQTNPAPIIIEQSGGAASPQ